MNIPPDGCCPEGYIEYYSVSNEWTMNTQRACPPKVTLQALPLVPSKTVGREILKNITPDRNKQWCALPTWPTSCRACSTLIFQKLSGGKYKNIRSEVWMNNDQPRALDLLLPVVQLPPSPPLSPPTLGGSWLPCMLFSVESKNEPRPKKFVHQELSRLWTPRWPYLASRLRFCCLWVRIRLVIYHFGLKQPFMYTLLKNFEFESKCDDSMRTRTYIPSFRRH